MSYFEMFVLLIAGHFIGDYVLQSNEIALGKNRSLDPARHSVPWYYWLAAHALTHGTLVYLVTQNIWLLLAETACHFVIDYAKCEKQLTIHQDQFFHVLCKAWWILILYVMTSL